MSRTFVKFSHQGANFRIRSSAIEVVENEIIRQRGVVADHIKRQPKFQDALEPIEEPDGCPEIVKRMFDASRKIGVGPMAAVAGAIAQAAAEAALRSGAREAIVENGGDMYLASNDEITVGLYAGGTPISGRIAFAVGSDRLPLAICSSSSKMGHSLSFGDCDLATVVARSAALADAAATRVCNAVKSENDVNPVIERILTIDDIDGVLIVKGDSIGMGGDLPELVRIEDPDFIGKITIDKESDHKPVERGRG